MKNNVQKQNACSLKKNRNILVRPIRAGFKGEQLGLSPWGLHKTEIESTNFTETFASLKPRKVRLYF
jgi:hypothetical protein